MEEKEIISHHKCDKCGNEWSESLMKIIDGDIQIVVLNKIKKPFVEDVSSKSKVKIKYG